MNRSKIVAVLTGAISILLAVAYLIIVQFLDFRGEMKPAPVGILDSSLVRYTYPLTHTANSKFAPSIIES